MIQFWPGALHLPHEPSARFAQLSRTILTATEIRAGDTSYRAAEVEAYEFAPGHADPFAHRHAVQEQLGRWYFHRVGSGYRGGSYKGTDLTFGGRDAPAGLLIRAVIRSDGRRVDGPSLVTDEFLRATGCATVAELDRACGPAGATDSALRLLDADGLNSAIVTTPRVGLSLKTHTAESIESATDFLLRPYRFLTDPAATRTGRVQLALALFGAGLTDAQVVAAAGFRPHVVAGYRRALDSGRGRALAEFAGRALTPRDWLALAGAARN